MPSRWQSAVFSIFCFCSLVIEPSTCILITPYQANTSNSLTPRSLLEILDCYSSQSLARVCIELSTISMVKIEVTVRSDARQPPPRINVHLRLPPREQNREDSMPVYDTWHQEPYVQHRYNEDDRPRYHRARAATVIPVPAPGSVMIRSWS